MVKVVIPIIKHIDPKLVLHEMLQKSFPKLEDIQLFCAGCAEVTDGVDITEILMRPDPNRSFGLPLHIACCQADSIDPQIIGYLVELCPDAISVQNKFGMNPLHCAVLNSKRPRLEIIRILCESSDYQACLQPNKQGMLPIHISLKSPRDFERGILNVILAENIKEQLLFQDSYGFVPLHQAATNKKSSVDLMEYLLSLCPRSAQVQDASGSLPLHWLLSSSDFPDVLVLRLLLMYHPASAMIKDKEGQLPISVYMYRPNKNPQVIQILLKQRQFVLDNPSCLVEHNNSIYSQSVASGDAAGSLACITGENSLVLGSESLSSGRTGRDSPDKLKKGGDVFSSGPSSPSSMQSRKSAGGERVRRAAAVGHSPGHGPRQATSVSPGRGRQPGRASASTGSASPIVSAGRRKSSAGSASPIVSAGRRKSSAGSASPVVPAGRRKSSAGSASPVASAGRRKSSTGSASPVVPAGRRKSSTGSALL